MLRTIPTALLCWLFLLAQSYGQDVFVPRQLKARAVTPSEKELPPQIQKAPPAKEPVVAKQSVMTRFTKMVPVNEPPANPRPEKVETAKAEPVKVPAVKEPPVNLHLERVQSVKADPVKVPAVKEPPANPRLEKVQSVKAEPAKVPVPVVKEPPANPHPEKVQSAKADPVKVPAVRESLANPHPEKVQSVKAEPAKVPAVKEPPANPRPEKVQTAKADAVKVPTVKESPANPHPERVQTVKADPVKVPAVKVPAVRESPANQRPEKVQSAKAEPVKMPAVKELPARPQPENIQSVKADPVQMPPAQEPTVNVQLLNRSMETASTRLADGFDFPVGKPEAEGYYKARGFRSGGHMGEDWDGVRGGDTDLNDPIYSIGDGIVVFARDVHLGWGNVVIVRHAYRENGTVKHIDSLYGHLNSILVNRGQKVARGQQIGKMGTAHGQYDAHLHLEIRKNLEIGMSRSKFQKNFSNYYDPSQFIASHRHLSGGGANFRVAMNTFTHDSAYHFDDSPNFSTRKHSTAQSAAALKEAISSTTR
jgi:murein DD-endopeptidase MepM/ murein hydrolase activator NlpD